jgi:hypothetical protein
MPNYLKTGPRIALLGMLLLGVGSRLALGDSIQGKVIDSKGQPIQDAVVRVFASRPKDAKPTTVPFMHLDTKITVQTDAKGEFTLSGFADGNEVVLMAGKSGYLMARTQYVTGEAGDVSLQLRATSELGIKTSLKGTLVDADGQPIAHAAVGYFDGMNSYSDNTFDPTCEPDLYCSGRQIVVGFSDGQSRFHNFPLPHAVLTSEDGSFDVPFNEREFHRMLVAYVPGSGRHRKGIEGLSQFLGGPNKLPDHIQWVVERGFSVTGRIANEQGPVSDYLVCMSYASGHGPNILLVVATQSDGTFTLDGIPTLSDSKIPVEYCVFGDFTQQDARGHLETKRLDPGQPGTTLDFGDLKLSPVVDFQLQFKLEDGPIEDPEAHMFVSLVQTCRILHTKIPADGRVLLKNFPREAVRFLVQAGTDVYCDPANPLQPHCNDRGFYFRAGDASELEVRLKRREPKP